MQYGLGPTIVSLIFLFLLLIIYRSKEKIESLEDKVFSSLLGVGLLLTTITIAYAVCLNEFNILILNVVLWKAYLVFLIGFFEMLTLYLVIMLENFKSKKVIDLWKSSKLLRILSISFVFIQIIYVLLPYKFFFKVFDQYNIYYTSNVLSLIVSVLCLVVIIFTTIMVKKHKEKLSAETVKNCYVIAYNTAFIILQILFPHIAIYPFASVLIITMIYLTFSNPDIEMQKELIKAKESIKQSSKAKAEFLSNVTSEIKTPVSYITSLSTNLESIENYDMQEIKKTMQQVILTGNNLLDIVNNVLDISKIESGKAIITENEYKMKNVIDRAINVAKSKIGSKPVNLEVKISPTLSTSYEGDEGKIYQALLNVLTNAAKYTEVGKIMFEVTNTKVSSGDKILFKVTDTGNGIKKEDQDKIFVKGTRLNNSIENEIEGSGYGLAITKEYLELIDGKIWFESEDHVGSTFYIEVVQKIVDSTPIGELVEEQQEENETINSNINCDGLVALVLDDNKLNVKVIKRLLERYYFKVVSVASGQECIYKIKSEEHFDIVFMDQVMEDMTGTDTMKALRGLEGYKIPPLVLLTANAVSGMKEKYIEEGFDDYIPKPITTPELEELLTKYFKKAEER